jgi:hypothetical protein
MKIALSMENDEELVTSPSTEESYSPPARPELLFLDSLSMESLSLSTPVDLFGSSPVDLLGPESPFIDEYSNGVETTSSIPKIFSTHSLEMRNSFTLEKRLYGSYLPSPNSPLQNKMAKLFKAYDHEYLPGIASNCLANASSNKSSGASTPSVNNDVVYIKPKGNFSCKDCGAVFLRFVLIFIS